MKPSCAEINSIQKGVINNANELCALCYKKNIVYIFSIVFGIHHFNCYFKFLLIETGSFLIIFT